MSASRARYFRDHVREVQRARRSGVERHRLSGLEPDHQPRVGTAARARTADFGLYHIDLGGDPTLERRPTPASATYRAIVQRRRA